MTYQGQVVSVPEMLDVLVANGRTDEAAARELATALEDRAIVLAYRSGHVLDPAEVEPVVAFIRAFPSRKVSIQTDLTAQRLSEGGAGAWRLQFEQACRINQLAKIDSTARRFANDETLVREAVAGISEGRWGNARQAAIALQPRAEGASPDSIIDRLRSKIRKALP